MSNKINPVSSSERYVILDVLRGIALLGICLANYPEFSLYTFQSDETVNTMPSANIDHIWKYLHYIFIEGKFYSLFSILFGIGFSIIISKIAQKYQNSFTVFYRRMLILALIGSIHLLCLWAGDILLLYALIGLLLPWFWKTSDKKILIFSAILIFLPVAIDAFRELTDSRFSLVAPVMKANAYFNEQVGINDSNFGVWLLEGKNYSDVLKFNLPGSFIRCKEFIEGNRVLKVLALFLFGLYIGRNRIYARLDDYKDILIKIRNYGFLFGLPLSCLFAWNEVNSHPLGLTISAVYYALSVVPLSLAYISAICLWYIKRKESRFFTIIAAPGRMALTNYIGQSIIGMVIFYGIGFEMALTGLIHTELIAIAVVFFQIIFSNFWLKYFQFGPVEWIWRMATYGKQIKFLNNNK